MNLKYLYTAVIIYTALSINMAFSQSNSVVVDTIIERIKFLENLPEQRLDYVSKIDHIYTEMYAQELYPYIKREYDRGEYIKDLDLKFNLYHLMESVYYAFPNYEKAAPIAYQLLEIGRQTKNPAHLYFAYSTIGADEEGLRGSEETTEFYLLAHKYAASNPSLLAKSNIELAMIFMDKEEYLTAREYLENAVQIAQKQNNLVQLCYAYSVLSDYYLIITDYDSSLKYYKKIDSITQLVPEFKDSRDVLSSTINAGMVYIQRKDFNSAETQLSKAAHLATISGDFEYLSGINNAFYQLEAAQNNYDKALIYYKASVAYKDSIYNEETRSQLNSLKITYELDKKESELTIAQKNEEYSIKQTWYILVISIIAIVTLALFLLYYRSQLKTSKIESDLINKEKEIKEIEIENLAHEVQLKNKELADLFLHQYEKAQLITDVVNNIDQSSEQIKSTLLSQLSKKEDWANFKMHFDKVHEGFFHKLSEISNELTTKDIRYCAYIRMNLTAKEIAIMLGISHRTVQGIRGRVRKKLDLESSTDLALFLMNL